MWVSCIVLWILCYLLCCASLYEFWISWWFFIRYDPTSGLGKSDNIHLEIIYLRACFSNKNIKWKTKATPGINIKEINIFLTWRKDVAIIMLWDRLPGILNIQIREREREREHHNLNQRTPGILMHSHYNAMLFIQWWKSKYFSNEFYLILSGSLEI